MHRLTIGCVCLLLLVGCSKRERAAIAPPQPPIVTVSPPVSRLVDTTIDFVGRMEAVESVEIRARVNGYLTKIHFKEGAKVKKGDLLYEIDVRPYQADLERMLAEVEKWKAEVKLAETELARTLKLTKTGSASVEDRDRSLANKAAADAQLLGSQAQVATARLNVEFTKITAPITGRMSRTYITEGNLVTNSESLLAKIVSEDPIYAFWDVDELTSLWYRDQINRRRIADPRGETPLRAWLKFKNEDVFSHEGYVDYINPELDRNTATRLVRGRFSNDTGSITPGDSVRVRVEAGAPREAVLIPQIAIGSRQTQKFVYVVNAENEVEFRPIELGSQRGAWQVVAKGLAATDRVIVNGILRVRPGVKVEPKPASAESLPPLEENLTTSKMPTTTGAMIPSQPKTGDKAEQSVKKS